MKLTLMSTLLGALSVFAPGLSASAITVNAGWYGYCFDDTAGDSITAGCQNSATAGIAGSPVTFTSTTAVLFEVTDAFQKGDRFNVRIDGGALQATSAIATDSTGATTDPGTAYADPTYSKGTYLLAAGSHSIVVTTLVSPFGGGGAYLQAVSATPEPSTLALIGLGIAGLGLRRFVRKRV